MKRKARNFLSIFTIMLFGACGSGGEGQQTSAQESMRLRQYMVQGKALYTTYCANCHQENGQGLAQLYPPLDSADYMLDDLERTACLIRNGMKGPILVNGITYNQEMPANKTLTAIEIAEIVTYISNSWENNKGLVNVTTVNSWLENCKTTD